MRRSSTLVILLTAASLGAADPASSGGGSQEDAGKALADHFAALKDVQSIAAKFSCEKRLQALETPLVSAGRVWIAKGRKPDEGAIRFSTEDPYRSELILAGGEVLGRSQHESEWTTQKQSSRPGLTAVMSQLGGWSTGGGGGSITDLSKMYSITREQTAPPPRPGTAPDNSQKLDTFTLTPTNKDMLKAIKKLSIGIDSASHQLRFLEILTQQDDITRYWFYDAKINAELPKDIFKPTDAPADAPPGEKP